VFAPANSPVFTVNLAVKVPEAVVVIVVGFRLLGVAALGPIVSVIVPPLLKPEPVTVTTVPIGPLLGESVIDG